MIPGAFTLFPTAVWLPAVPCRLCPETACNSDAAENLSFFDAKVFCDVGISIAKKINIKHASQHVILVHG